MFTLIIGGAASGKSEYAEKTVLSLTGKRIYLATMEPWDDECRARIEKHRLARAKREFETIERYVNLEELLLPENSNVLLECLGNLVANEQYHFPESCSAERIAHGVLHVKAQSRHLTVVTNEVFSGGIEYLGDTQNYLRILGELNCMLAAQADCVVEVICGIPCVRKGAAI